MVSTSVLQRQRFAAVRKLYAVAVNRAYGVAADFGAAFIIAALPGVFDNRHARAAVLHNAF